MDSDQLFDGNDDVEGVDERDIEPVGDTPHEAAIAALIGAVASLPAIAYKGIGPEVAFLVAATIGLLYLGFIFAEVVN